MTVRRTQMLILIFACTFCSPLCAQDPPKNNEEQSAEELRIRHAEARLELAKVQLKMLQQNNKESPGAISQAEIERAEMNIAVAREQLKLAKTPSADATQLHLKRAEQQAKFAKDQYENAQKAKASFAESFSDLKLEEYRLKAEVAQLRLEMWKHPQTNMLSLLDHMHWQLERVSEELVALQKRVDQLGQNRID